MKHLLTALLLLSGLTGQTWAQTGHEQRSSTLKGGRIPWLITADTRPPKFSVRAGRLSFPGELFVVDGETGKEISLPTRSYAGLMVYWSTTPNDHWRYASVTVRNRLDRQMKLELGLRVRSELPMTTFFDGARVDESGSERVADRFTGRFPLTTVSDAGRCIALGYLPDQWLSYLRHTYSPWEGGFILETATRIVVDPGEQEQVDFLIGGFTTEWGHSEALHWYYESFPAFFRPNSQVDPRAGLNGGSYRVWSPRPDPELCRRLSVGWDWCYAPFRRTGDIYGRPQFWDYTPARRMSTMRSLPIDEYHAERRKRFERGRECDVAMMCYIPSQIWCEEQLARERYADALTTDTRVKTHFTTPWVTGHDDELRVFPYKTSFGDQSVVDMADLVRENNIQGFAFDTANGGGRYFGPHVDECPGRAWDDRGVYVDEGVAIAKLMDWCHANTDGAGRPLAVVSNPGGAPCYLTPFRSDAAMIEADPTSVHSGSAMVLRRFLGHKTMVFWENYDLERILDYENLTTEQMADALRGLADYTIIASLRLAALPTPRITSGMRKLARWTPLLREIALAGWQPVPAATCDVDLPVSRAGEGLRQFIMTGNENSQALMGTLEIRNRWLAGGAMLFCRENEAETENQVRDGMTRAPVAIPPRGALVLRSIADFSPSPTSLDCGVTVTEDLDGRTIRLRSDAAQAANCTLRVPRWGDFELASVLWDGQPVECESCPGGWRSREPVRLAGRQDGVISLRSKVFDITKAQLLGFPWVSDDTCGFDVVCSRRDPSLDLAVNRLVGYFPYYYAGAVTPAREVAPAAIVDAPGNARPTVVLRVDPDQGRRVSVSLQQDPQPTLTVSGRTPADAKHGVLLTLAALDTTYEYGGGIVGTAAIRATGLDGKELP